MKITSVTKNQYETSSSKNSVSVQPPRMLEQPAKDSVSFSGNLKSGASRFFNFIDKKGFFVEFLVVDTLSMIIPRVLIGLDRDKEKTGKVNYKAGAEEAGREVLSGPSMGLIPMAILALVSHKNPASHIQKDTLEGLTETMKKVVEESKDLTKHDELNKNLADKMFDNAFGKHQFEGKAELKTEFSKILNESTTLDSRMFKNAAYKEKAEEFEKLVSKLNNRTMGATANSRSFNFGLVDKSIEARDLFTDFRHYSKDIVAKVTKETTAEAAKTSLDKALKSRLNVKLATAITGFMAVGAFLLYLPRLYQQSGLSPAQESAKRAQAEAAQGGANENK